MKGKTKIGKIEIEKLKIETKTTID